MVESAQERAEEWRKEITYEAEVGAIFKDTLRISPEGIEWKGRRWPLDSITRIRWGGTKHSVNFIPTGTTYNVIFGNDSSCDSIDMRKSTTFTNFVDRLWKAVGVRLLTEYLEGLRAGKKYRFGDIFMSDHGIELVRYKFLGDNEHVFCQWSELSIWNAPGAFCIGKKGGKHLDTVLSYQEEDNIHILEAAIRMFWKRGGARISSILEG